MIIQMQKIQNNGALGLSKFNFYFSELRRNLIYIILFFIFVFMCLAPFSKKIYNNLADPLQKILPPNAHMIATDITSTFVAPFKLVFFVTVTILIPFIFLRIYFFLREALYLKEKKVIFIFCSMSTLLFYFGILLGYFYILPTVLSFFVSIAPDTVIPMTDINQYLIFCIKFFLVLGFIFQLPLVIVILIYFNFINVENLINKRSYALVLSFFIAMFITPPDIFSMAIAGICIYILFELGLLISRIMLKYKE